MFEKCEFVFWRFFIKQYVHCIFLVMSLSSCSWFLYKWIWYTFFARFRKRVKGGNVSGESYSLESFSLLSSWSLPLTNRPKKEKKKSPNLLSPERSVFFSSVEFYNQAGRARLARGYGNTQTKFRLYLGQNLRNWIGNKIQIQ